MASSSKDSKDASFLSRTGGAYIPPMKLKMMMQQQMADKSGASYQRLSWEALKKSIHGFVNKINTPNIANVIRELFSENLVRGRGLLCRSLIQCQTFSPTYTNVFASLVAVVNTKFPAIGELLLRRLIISFRKGYKRRDKNLCLASTRFVAHLVNQQVAHELLALEILMLLLEQPTDDSVEVAIAFLKECGARLKLVSPRGLVAITDRLRAVLHEAQIDPRTQYMIEVMFAVIKDNFKDHPTIVPELDLVEEGDQYTHLVSLEDDISEERELDVFKYDENFLDNEAKYEEIKREILGDDDGEGGEGAGDGDEDEEGDEEGEGNEGDQADQAIIDNTEVNMVNLRRTIYLAIQSSLNFEEAAHKLLKMTLKPEQEQELCYMIIDCCAQLRTYEKFYGLLAERFCKINQKFVEPFQRIFREQYETCHRLELMKLRNVAKVFAHLLFSDAINWTVLSVIKLTEETTTSSGRIFIKILFQELAEHMGVMKLSERLQDPTLKASFDGIFPTDSPKNIRFSINFFTAIGLGGLTDELRDVLKNSQKPTAQLQQRIDQLANMSGPAGAPLAIKQEKEDKPSAVKEEKRPKKSSKKKDKKRRGRSPSPSSSEEEEDRRAAKSKRSKGAENFPVQVKLEKVSVERELEPPPARRRRSPSRSPPPDMRRREAVWKAPSPLAQRRRAATPSSSASGSPPPPPRRNEEKRARRSPPTREVVPDSREKRRQRSESSEREPPKRQQNDRRQKSPPRRRPSPSRSRSKSASRSPPPQLRGRDNRRSPSPPRRPRPASSTKSASPPPLPPKRKDERGNRQQESRRRSSSRSASPPRDARRGPNRPAARSPSPARRSRSRSPSPPRRVARRSPSPQPVRRSPSPKRRDNNRGNERADSPPRRGGRDFQRERSPSRGGRRDVRQSPPSHRRSDDSPPPPPPRGREGQQRSSPDRGRRYADDERARSPQQRRRSDDSPPARKQRSPSPPAPPPARKQRSPSPDQRRRRESPPHRKSPDRAARPSARDEPPQQHNRQRAHDIDAKHPVQPKRARHDSASSASSDSSSTSSSSGSSSDSSSTSSSSSGSD